MKIIDLSTTLENDRSWAPWWARTRVKYQDHAFGAWAIWLVFGVARKHLRTGLGWANEILTLSTHSTTHVDAPWHYAPTCEGKKAPTIDELPLERFYAPGVVLDLRHLRPDQAASTADLQAALAKIDHTLSPGQIVLIQTGNDSLLGNPEYFHTGPGVSGEATRWLIDQGIKVMGIDAWGWDRPLRSQAAEAKRTGSATVFWEAHFVGVDRDYCQIERLAHLDQLPPTGFTVCAFPLKVKNGSAGPARVVALLHE
ncbi:Kynurenine formamidase [Lignipirellula cremea]|uniref:Kynurenine formamidase n=2 Tax=Lignipirellula cremea TaxID=2528010 RepID=A0A518E1F2_9BACT|nr:Kynurenine formamidase [Lignipirellula cremea]